MRKLINNISPRTAGIIAGFGYLIWIISGSFLFTLLNAGINEGIPGEDAIIAASNIMTNKWLILIVIVSILFIVLGNLMVTLGLYIIFKPINKKLSILVAVLKLIFAGLFVITMILLFNEPRLFSDVFAIGQIFYALNMMAIGYIIFKSGSFPRIMGVLLIIGAIFGYLTEDLIHFILPTNLVWIAFPGLVVVIIAEITFCVWLLLKNVKTHEINTSDI